MKLNEVKDYTLGVLRGAFKNKDILDNLSAEGRDLRYKGKNLGDSYMFDGIENYTEEERLVGRWIDGKPLYEITIYSTDTSKLGTLSTWMVLADLTNYNIDTVVDLRGGFGNTGGSWYAFPACTEGGYYFEIRVRNQNKELAFYQYWDRSVNSLSATIQYTKTTDAAGSGEDLIEGPANFVDGATYSEEERIIGQWIDGKPLYSKTVEGTTPNSSSAVTAITLDSDCIIKRFDGINNGFGLNYYDGSNWCTHTWIGGTNKITMQNGSSFINKPYSITILYTKTGDEAQDMSITPTLTVEATDDEVAEVFT